MEGKKEEIELLIKKYRILKEISRFLRVEETKTINTLRRFKKDLEK